MTCGLWRAYGFLAWAGAVVFAFLAGLNRSIGLALVGVGYLVMAVLFTIDRNWR